MKVLALAFVVLAIAGYAPVVPTNPPPPATIPAAPVANTTPAPSYCVTAETLNVRTGPGVEFDSVAILYQNECVHVYQITDNQDGSTWGEVAPGRWVNVAYIR